MGGAYLRCLRRNSRRHSKRLPSPWLYASNRRSRGVAAVTLFVVCTLPSDEGQRKVVIDQLGMLSGTARKRARWAGLALYLLLGLSFLFFDDMSLPAAHLR